MNDIRVQLQDSELKSDGSCRVIFSQNTARYYLLHFSLEIRDKQPDPLLLNRLRAGLSPRYLNLHLQVLLCLGVLLKEQLITAHGVSELNADLDRAPLLTDPRGIILLLHGPEESTLELGRVSFA